MKWIGQHIWDLISRFRANVYLDYTMPTTPQTDVVGVGSDGKLYKQPVKVLDCKAATYHSSYINTQYFIPISGANYQESSNQNSYISQYTVPYNGKIIRIASQSPSVTMSTSLTMFKNHSATQVGTTMASSDPSYNALEDFVSNFQVDCPSDWVFNKGDTIAIGRTDNTSATGTNMTIVFEYDITT